MECIPAKNFFFFFAFKRKVRKIFNEDVLCILANFDVFFLQVKKIDPLVRLVRPFIHHCSRFGSMQIQCKKDKVELVQAC